MLKNVLLFLLTALVLSLSYIYMYMHESDVPEESSTLQQSEILQGDGSSLPYGPVTLTIGQKAEFPAVSIKATAIEEESRCPLDVQCIQAGTVRVEVEIVSGMGTSSNSIKLGEFVTTESESIEFISASPHPVPGAHIPNSAYQLTFEVTQRTEVPYNELEIVVPDAPAKICYIGGCSGQLCSDTKAMASTCEYKEEYACYRKSSCEVQPDGECGWTLTPQLTACLQQSSSQR